MTGIEQYFGTSIKKPHFPSTEKMLFDACRREKGNDFRFLLV